MSIPTSKIRTELTRHFAATLRLSEDQIAPDIHILELGMDSIMLMEAQRWLKDRYGCAIEMQRFFDELNTIDAIADFIAANASIGETTPTGRDAAAAPEPQTDQAAAIKVTPEQSSPSQASKDFDLMRAQLSLLRDVIEAQNRILSNINRSRTGHDA